MNVQAQHDADPIAPGSARLFIALWPDVPLRRAFGAWLAPGLGGTGVKPVARERLHLTLHFLAGVPGDRLPALCAALQVPFQPFLLRFSRCAAWPGGLLVAPPDEEPPALTALQADLGHALHHLGLPVETRPYRPHITLARRCAGPPPGPAPAPLRWDVRAYALVWSRTREGGGYEVLHIYHALGPQAQQNARWQGT
jgi:2'-5' RNA ligase